ncbi:MULTISPECIES: FAD-binding and (Fe-S)-binding domain-containing protein [Cupriavidus]|uniref:4Fe-4S ferredoxin, iron-sulfur binding:FAD linked oxidase, C-terminal:FAD linked oxidase, N-terminal n=1 Tax=Cupriavidus pinatubonensis (strain JMP 134 / LMG 1197) TaxID=264198 RepID=Q46SU1_CUPPJ|nr:MULTISPECIES: FAD-binding and (Fe-S)-binding domain-containing protein [Cupriavidus]TPQ38039.1 FAD-binding oxidoreductase [Cupriavidus pinatubonensis]
MSPGLLASAHGEGFAALETALRDTVDAEVRFDAGSRALYATDASNYRQVPIGVVIPRSVQAVIDTVALCRRHGAPVLSRGGGTSLCGQTCNVAVVLDFSKYLNRILSIDPQEKTARVQPGVVLDRLRDAAEAHHLTFAPDPATHTHNTLGGMIGNNSCGPHSVMGGETIRNVIELDILTYDGTRLTVGATTPQAWDALAARSDRVGEIYRLLRTLRDEYQDDIRQHMPRIPRRVSGYPLEALLPEYNGNIAHSLVGTEGTCVIVLEAKLRLVDSPRARSLLALGYPDVFHAADHVLDVMASGPIAVEGMDDRLIADMTALHLHPEDVALLPPGNGWLLAEFGGDDKAQADDRARKLMDTLKAGSDAPSMKLFDDPAEEQLIWRVRESGLGATAHVPNQKITWEGWEDSAVPPRHLAEYLRRLRELFDRYGYACALYGHFGQGCVHTRIDFDLETAQGIEIWQRFLQDAAHLVVSLGGSISGEHGDGQSKADLLPIMYPERLMRAFGRFKQIWDPLNRMNPGKVVNAWHIDQNLRIGTDYNPPEQPVYFHYTTDSGSFPRAVLRCVGVGECRKNKGVMCPSYMATGEERHSTRGRARMLFEMLKGEVVQDGWRSEAVHEALDLCLSCKGCRGECPVNVDMAIYRAEFMAHYYERRHRPREAFAFGLVDQWARLGMHAPGLFNLLTHAPLLSLAAHKLANVASGREIPRFAKQSFRDWFATRPRQAPHGRRVILWPDTFTNAFEPDIARDAVSVLEATGHDVHIPPQPLCCGRPLYEYGMLDRARAYLRDVLDTLAEDIRRGTPVVVLEPACLSVFHEEMRELLGGDEQAMRLRQQSFLLPDFLCQRDALRGMHTLSGNALVHAHCHHRSIWKTAGEEEALRAVGVVPTVLDSGCCGMAGSFGFLPDKQTVSNACAQRTLIPKILAKSAGTMVVADGFSCRLQIRHHAGTVPLHIAQMLARAGTASTG